MSACPRILLVPALTELEWEIKPQLEEWAEVASFDPPGVGDEPPAEYYNDDAIRDRGLAEIDRRGWEACVIAGDEYAAYTAVRVAAARPAVAQGLALGHACLSLRDSGERPTLNATVLEVFWKLLDSDYRAFARHLTQITQSAYGDELADRYIERVPQAVAKAYRQARMDDAVEPTVRSLDIPLLLAKHEGCLAWTDEGFEDIVAAFPGAVTLSVTEKPSVSTEFARALRQFCERLGKAATPS